MLCFFSNENYRIDAEGALMFFNGVNIRNHGIYQCHLSCGIRSNPGYLNINGACNLLSMYMNMFVHVYVCIAAVCMCENTAPARDTILLHMTLYVYTEHVLHGVYTCCTRNIHYDM